MVGGGGLAKVSSDCHTSSGFVVQPQGTQRQVPTRNTRAGASKGRVRVCVYVRISSHTGGTETKHDRNLEEVCVCLALV